MKNKNILKKILVFVSIIFISISNVSADEKGMCTGNRNDIKTEGRGATSSREFTLTKNNKSCSIRFKVALGGQTKKYYIEYKVNDKYMSLSNNATEFKCNDFIVKLDNSASNGFDLKNLSCGYYSSEDTFKVTGIENQGNYGVGTTCSGGDYNFPKNGQTCKVEIKIDQYKKVTLKYGDINNFNNATSIKNPNINDFKCEINGETISIKSDKIITDGISTCPILTADVSSELDNADGDHTDRSEQTTYVNGAEFSVDGSLEELISKYQKNSLNYNPGEIQDCNNIINSNLKGYLEKIFTLMKYIGIILCVGLTIVDFAKTLLDSDKDALNKITKRALTRLILVAILFFLPTLVNFIIGIFVENPCKIDF